MRNFALLLATVTAAFHLLVPARRLPLRRKHCECSLKNCEIFNRFLQLPFFSQIHLKGLLMWSRTLLQDFETILSGHATKERASPGRHLKCCVYKMYFTWPGSSRDVFLRRIGLKYILARAISKMLNKFMHIRNTKGAGKVCDCFLNNINFNGMQITWDGTHKTDGCLKVKTLLAARCSNLHSRMQQLPFFSSDWRLRFNSTHLLLKALVIKVQLPI